MCASIHVLRGSTRAQRASRAHTSCQGRLWHSLLGSLRKQWDALQVYLGDGRMLIDSDETEQLMKQRAIGLPVRGLPVRGTRASVQTRRSVDGGSERRAE